MEVQRPILRESLPRIPSDVSKIPSRGGIIHINHPGYPEEQALLLTLHGHDDLQGSISFGIALTACAVVACNCFDGWISTASAADAPRLTSISVLPPGNYWFHVPNPDGKSSSEEGLRDDLVILRTAQSQQAYQYPVVPNFRNWRFPRDVPPLWQMPIADTNTDTVPSIEDIQTCRLTQQSHAVDQAHIIPSGEEQWFTENNMGVLSEHIAVVMTGPDIQSDLDRESNRLALRTDIHRLWDQKQLTFVPKVDHDGRTHLVVHCLKLNRELIQLYHNRRLAATHNKPWEFFLARFAWTLFPGALNRFLGQRKPRVLQLLREDGKFVQEEVSGMDCLALRDALRPRSTSLKKRKAAGGLVVPQGGGLGLFDGGNSSPTAAMENCMALGSGLNTPDSSDECDYEYEREMETRGRKRWRA